MTGNACISYFFHYCDKMLDKSNLRKVSFLLALSLREYSPVWQERAVAETRGGGSHCSHSQNTEITFSILFSLGS